MERDNRENWNSIGKSDRKRAREKEIVCKRNREIREEEITYPLAGAVLDNSQMK